MNENMKGSFIIMIAVIGGILIGNVFPLLHTSKPSIAIAIPTTDTLSYDQMHDMSIDILDDERVIDKNNSEIQKLFILYVGKDSTLWKPVDQVKYERLSGDVNKKMKEVNDKIYEYNRVMNNVHYDYIYSDVPLPGYFEYRN